MWVFSAEAAGRSGAGCSLYKGSNKVKPAHLGRRGLFCTSYQQPDWNPVECLDIISISPSFTLFQLKLRWTLMESVKQHSVQQLNPSCTFLWGRLEKLLSAPVSECVWGRGVRGRVCVFSRRYGLYLSTPSGSWRLLLHLHQSFSESLWFSLDKLEFSE